MGLSNSPGAFQHATTSVLPEHICAGYCKVYLDDILIMSKSIEEHARHVDAVLSSLRDHSLFCQLPKCKFGLNEVSYPGHWVCGEGVKPDPKKVVALDKWDPPTELVEELADPNTTERHAKVLRKRIATQTRSFLGFMQYFSRFIPRYSALVSVLFDQLKDNAQSWTRECTLRWQQRKTCLQKATLMHHPDFDKLFHVYTDASLRGIGGV
jgi:hypothetical protein